jgi:transcriptional regulator with XRE-family HTH domain
MKNGNTESIRTRVISLIEAGFESDAAFERVMELPQKTVNNWRRGLSSSFMKILPRLSEEFGVNVGELLDIPLRRDTSELSEEELHILHLYRKARTMPQPMRAALRDTIETTINMYISSYQAVKQKRTSKAKN